MEKTSVLPAASSFLTLNTVEMPVNCAIFPKNDKEMEKAFDRIRTELHLQYRMGYVPAPAEGRGGQWRDIRVELTRRRDLIVRSRLGYYNAPRAR